MTSGEALTADRVQALEERLRSAGVQLDAWSQPGLGVDAIEQRVAPLGLRLPDEATVWWAWRNGETKTGWAKVLPEWRRFASLEQAIATYEQVRRVAAEDGDPSVHPDEQWRPAWFPLSDHKSTLVLDCSVAPGEPSPVRVHNFEDTIEEHETIRASSFGDVVALWCTAIDTGVWEWDASAEKWWPHWERLDDFGLSALT